MPPRKLTRIETSTLEAEIKRRRRRLPALEKKRTKLLAQIEDLETEIESLGGSANAARRGRKPGGTRPRNELSLVEAIEKVLKSDKPMGISEVIEGVTKVGYRSNAENFRTIVNQALLREKQFKKSGRGMYVLAKAKK